MRDLAKKRGVTFLELIEISKTDETVDRQLDGYQIRLGKEENNFVIDSRIGFFFIPQSYKVFLHVDDAVAAQRIMQSQRESEPFKSIKDALASIKTRKHSEKLRYKKYYNLDFPRDSYFDLVIDTSRIPTEKIAEQIIQKVRKAKVKVVKEHV